MSRESKTIEDYIAKKQLGYIHNDGYIVVNAIKNITFIIYKKDENSNIWYNSYNDRVSESKCRHAKESYSIEKFMIINVLTDIKENVMDCSFLQLKELGENANQNNAEKALALYNKWKDIDKLIYGLLYDT